jgi:hypothetical protein
MAGQPTAHLEDGHDSLGRALNFVFARPSSSEFLSASTRFVSDPPDQLVHESQCSRWLLRFELELAEQNSPPVPSPLAVLKNTGIARRADH